MAPPPREGVGDPAGSSPAATPTAGRAAGEALTSPFLQASAAAASASEQRGHSTSDHAEEDAGGATAIEVGKPLPKSVAPLYAVDDGCSSGTESDSSFGSRLLDHEGEETFGLQITREVEITNDEFEYLATGEVPQLPTGPAAPLLFRALSRRRRLSAAEQQQEQHEEEEEEEVSASASAQHRQGRKNFLGGKHRHLFSAGLPAGSEAPHRRGGGGRDHDHGGACDDYAYSSYYRKQAERHAGAEARKAERRNVRGAGLFAPWGRAATSAREPYALFDPRKEARSATRLFRGRSLLLLPLVHPHSLVSRCERLLVALLDCTYSAFVVPIAIAYVPPREYSFWSGYALSDIVVGLIFTADILFALHRAVVVRHHFRRRLLGDGRLILRAYLFHGTGVIDIITTLPFWAQAVAILVGSANSPTAVKALLGLRALRLLRVVPAVSRMFDLSASDIGRSLSGVLSSTALYLGALIYTAAVLVNMISCLWYFVARVEGAFDDHSEWPLTGPGGTPQRPMSWITAATLGETPLAECNKARIYLAGAYFAVTTLTTVGYGDITPKTSLEHGVAIGVMFVGILFFSFVVNSMGAALASSSAAARRSAALRAKFAEVEGWARARALPPALRRRILEYYGEVWVRKEEWREADLYSELPAPLRAEVTRALALDVFRASDLLAAAPEPLLHDMAAAMEPVTVFPGHDLCEQGEEADGLWVMHEGELLLLRDGVPVDIVRAPAMLGECVVLADRLPEAGRRLVTMRAVELCTLWRLPLPRLRLLMERCPEIEASIVGEFKEHVRKFAARARRAAGRSAKKAAAAAAAGRASAAGNGGGGSSTAAPSPSPSPGPETAGSGGGGGAGGSRSRSSKAAADLDAAVERGVSTVAEGLDAMLLRLEEAAGIVVSGSSKRSSTRSARSGGKAAPRAASFGGFGRRGEESAAAAVAAADAARPATASRLGRPASEGALGGLDEEETGAEDEEDDEEREEEEEEEVEEGSSALVTRGAALAAADTEAFDQSTTPAASASASASVAPGPAAALLPPAVNHPASSSLSASVPGGTGSTFGRRTLDRLRASLGSQGRGGRGGGGGGEAPTTLAGSVAGASVASSSSATRRSRRGSRNGGNGGGGLQSRSASLPLPSSGTAAVRALSASALAAAGARTHRRQPSASDVATSHEVLASALAASLRAARLRHAAQRGDREAQRELRGETLVEEYVRLAEEEREERRRRAERERQQRQEDRSPGDGGGSGARGPTAS